jgi:hypothetical protein
MKLDPSGGLLQSFVALINKVLDRLPVEDRQRIGVHVCPGGGFRKAILHRVLFVPRYSLASLD